MSAGDGARNGQENEYQKPTIDIVNNFKILKVGLPQQIISSIACKALNVLSAYTYWHGICKKKNENQEIKRNRRASFDKFQIL